MIIIKTSHIPTIVIKLYLSKAYDRVPWLYLHLLLIHMGFALSLVKWIMGCVNITSFEILIHVSASKLFKYSRGLKHGWPLSTYLFILVVERLSRAISGARRMRRNKGVRIRRSKALTHLLFVDDDLLIFYFE